MLIKEVRSIIKNYSEEELRILIAEMYKVIPKKVKQEKNIDKMIEDINNFMRSRKRVTRQKESIDLESLKYEIEEFIDYSYKQYYFAPNSYVHKSERSKWRFKVSKFIKELEKVNGNAEDNATATELLEKLYEVLCYGYYYVIFSSNEPFRSIRMSQSEVFDMVIRRKFADGINKESITYALKLMAANKPDSNLIPEILKYLKTPDSKQLAIEQCNFLKQIIKDGGLLTGSKLEQTHSGEYITSSRINVLVEMAFYCYLELSEHKTACEYFKNNYEESDSEVRLYVLLLLLFTNGLKDCWVYEYEKAVEEGIKPRKRLTDMYSYILENNKLPDFMF